MLRLPKPPYPLSKLLTRRPAGSILPTLVKQDSSVVQENHPKTIRILSDWCVTGRPVILSNIVKAVDRPSRSTTPQTAWTHRGLMALRRVAGGNRHMITSRGRRRRGTSHLRFVFYPKDYRLVYRFYQPHFRKEHGKLRFTAFAYAGHGRYVPPRVLLRSLNLRRKARSRTKRVGHYDPGFVKLGNVSMYRRNDRMRSTWISNRTGPRLFPDYFNTPRLKFVNREFNVVTGFRFFANLKKHRVPRLFYGNRFRMNRSHTSQMGLVGYFHTTSRREGYGSLPGTKYHWMFRKKTHFSGTTTVMSLRHMVSFQSKWLLRGSRESFGTSLIGHTPWRSRGQPRHRYIDRQYMTRWDMAPFIGDAVQEYRDTFVRNFLATEWDYFIMSQDNGFMFEYYYSTTQLQKYTHNRWHGFRMLARSWISPRNAQVTANGTFAKKYMQALSFYVGRLALRTISGVSSRGARTPLRFLATSDGFWAYVLHVMYRVYFKVVEYLGSTLFTPQLAAATFSNARRRFRPLRHLVRDLPSTGYSSLFGISRWVGGSSSYAHDTYSGFSVTGSLVALRRQFFAWGGAGFASWPSPNQTDTTLFPHRREQPKNSRFYEYRRNFSHYRAYARTNRPSYWTPSSVFSEAVLEDTPAAGSAAVRNLSTYNRVFRDYDSYPSDRRAWAEQYLRRVSEQNSAYFVGGYADFNSQHAVSSDYDYMGLATGSAASLVHGLGAFRRRFDTYYINLLRSLSSARATQMRREYITGIPASLGYAERLVQREERYFGFLPRLAHRKHGVLFSEDNLNFSTIRDSLFLSIGTRVGVIGVGSSTLVDRYGISGSINPLGLYALGDMAIGAAPSVRKVPSSGSQLSAVLKNSTTPADTFGYQFPAYWGGFNLYRNLQGSLLDAGVSFRVSALIRQRRGFDRVLTALLWKVFHTEVILNPYVFELRQQLSTGATRRLVRRVGHILSAWWRTGVAEEYRLLGCRFTPEMAETLFNAVPDRQGLLFKYYLYEYVRQKYPTQNLIGISFRGGSAWGLPDDFVYRKRPAHNLRGGYSNQTHKTLLASLGRYLDCSLDVDTLRAEFVVKNPGAFFTALDSVLVWDVGRRLPLGPHKIQKPARFALDPDYRRSTKPQSLRSRVTRYSFAAMRPYGVVYTPAVEVNVAPRVDATVLPPMAADVGLRCVVHYVGCYTPQYRIGYTTTPRLTPVGQKKARRNYRLRFLKTSRHPYATVACGFGSENYRRREVQFFWREGIGTLLANRETWLHPAAQDSLSLAVVGNNRHGVLLPQPHPHQASAKQIFFVPGFRAPISTRYLLPVQTVTKVTPEVFISATRASTFFVPSVATVSVAPGSDTFGTSGGWALRNRGFRRDWAIHASKSSFIGNVYDSDKVGAEVALRPAAEAYVGGGLSDLTPMVGSGRSSITGGSSWNVFGLDTVSSLSDSIRSAVMYNLGTLRTTSSHVSRNMTSPVDRIISMSDLWWIKRQLQLVLYRLPHLRTINRARTRFRYVMRRSRRYGVGEFGKYLLALMGVSIFHNNTWTDPHQHIHYLSYYGPNANSRGGNTIYGSGYGISDHNFSEFFSPSLFLRRMGAPQHHEYVPGVSERFFSHIGWGLTFNVRNPEFWHRGTFRAWGRKWWYKKFYRMKLTFGRIHGGWWAMNWTYRAALHSFWRNTTRSGLWKLWRAGGPYDGNVYTHNLGPILRTLRSWFLTFSWYPAKFLENWTTVLLLEPMSTYFLTPWTGRIGRYVVGYRLWDQGAYRTLDNMRHYNRYNRWWWHASTMGPRADRTRWVTLFSLLHLPTEDAGYSAWWFYCSMLYNNYGPLWAWVLAKYCEYVRTFYRDYVVSGFYRYIAFRKCYYWGFTPVLVCRTLVAALEDQFYPTARVLVDILWGLIFAFHGGSKAVAHNMVRFYLRRLINNLTLIRKESVAEYRRLSAIPFRTNLRMFWRGIPKFLNRLLLWVLRTTVWTRDSNRFNHIQNLINHMGITWMFRVTPFGPHTYLLDRLWLVYSALLSCWDLIVELYRTRIYSSYLGETLKEYCRILFCFSPKLFYFYFVLFEFYILVTNVLFIFFFAI